MVGKERDRDKRNKKLEEEEKIDRKRQEGKKWMKSLCLNTRFIFVCSSL